MAGGMDPYARVRGDRGIRLVRVAVDIRITRDRNSCGPVGEVVNILGADDVDFGQPCGRRLGRRASDIAPDD